MLTRDDVMGQIDLARTFLGKIHYTQNGTNPYTDRRSDCSGFASFCGKLRTTGPGIYLRAFSTSTLVTQGLIVKIDRAELLPGDMIGYCGPTTAGGGGGHIAMWLGKMAGTGKEHILDHGSGWGPTDRSVTWGLGTGWQAPGKIGAWRFAALVGDVAEGIEGDMYTAKNANGKDVETLQRRLMAANGEGAWVKGSGCLPNYGPDGGYGDETARALAAVIAGAPNVTPDGSVYGPAELVAVDVALAKRYGGVDTPAVLVPHTHAFEVPSYKGTSGPAKA